MKKISCLLAGVILAMSMVFTVQASESDPTFGHGEGYWWQYNCESFEDVTSVTLTNFVNPLNDATYGLLENCSVVVTVYLGEHYYGWDFEDPALIDIVDIAESLKVPILFQLVDQDNPFSYDRKLDDAHTPDFSPPILADVADG